MSSDNYASAKIPLKRAKIHRKLADENEDIPNYTQLLETRKAAAFFSS